MAGLGAAFSATLTGVGLSTGRAGHVQDRISTRATTCGGCPAGCGILAHSFDGRVQEITGNPAHIRNRGSICPGSQSGLQKLYAPARFTGPQRRSKAYADLAPISWDRGIADVADALGTYRSSEIAFLFGLFPDHLHDLGRRLAKALGSVQVFRYAAGSEFEGQVTLLDAAQSVFGMPKIPYFDYQNAAVLFSFGASFQETWLAPGEIEPAGRNPVQRPGYVVQFEPRRSPAAAAADEWVSIRPGSEPFLAQALAWLVAEERERIGEKDSMTPFVLSAALDVAEAARKTGLPLAELKRLARLFVAAPTRLAIPGGGPLGYPHGAVAARAILVLNVVAGNLGKPGGIYFVPDLPIHADFHNRPGTMAELRALFARIHHGQIKALFVHGVDPVSALPGQLRIQEALDKLECLVSFASAPNATTAHAHLVLPDRTPLESWGYQQLTTGVDRMALSALQPVVKPAHNTRATVDILLAAAQRTGGNLALALPFRDEIDFLQRSLSTLQRFERSKNAQKGESFWEAWLDNCGWRLPGPSLIPAVSITPPDRLLSQEWPKIPEATGEFNLRLLSYPGAPGNDMWIAKPVDDLNQPATSHSAPGGLWAEIHPQTAQAHNCEDGDHVCIQSAFGQVVARVRRTEDVQPGVVAVAFTVESGPGNLPMFALLGDRENEAGNWAVMGAPVRLERISAPLRD